MLALRELLLLILCTFAACASPAAMPDAASPDSRAPTPNAVDILLVVDTSESMAEEQQGLVNCCPSGIKPFINLPGGMPDLRIGMITANLGGPGFGADCSVNGDQAKLRSTGASNCPSEAWLEATATTSNIPGCAGGADCVGPSISQCIGYPWPRGCSFGQPLEAARRFLEGEKTKPAGFVRENAVLAILFVADEDDCSAKDASFFETDPTLGPVTTFRCFEHGVSCSNDPADRSTPGVRNNCQPSGDKLVPVGEYITFLESLKPKGQLIVGAVAGPTKRIEVVKRADGTPSLATACNSLAGVATPTIRLKKVTDAFSGASFFASICDGFWSDTVLQLAASTYAKLRSEAP